MLAIEGEQAVIADRHAMGVAPEIPEGDLAIATALALLDAEHHALAIDVADFELTRFAAPQAGAVQGEEQRAMIQILRARDETLHLVGTEHDR